MSRPHILRLLAILAFLACLPASATINAPVVTSSAGGVSSGASTTIPSTVTGDTIVITGMMEATGTGTVSSCTDGGDTFVVAFASTNLTTTTRTGFLCYILSGAGGKTAAVVNFSGANDVVYTVLTYHSTLGALAFDVSNSTNSIGSTATPVGPSVTTTGTSDVIVGLLITNVQGATGNLVNTGVTFTLEASPIGGFAAIGVSDTRNIAAGTYAPKWQLAGADISASIVASFKEVSRGGTTIF